MLQSSRDKLQDWELSTQFLAKPLLDNIDKEPKAPYELRTEGRIHSKDLQQMVSVLLSDPDSWKSHIQDILEGKAYLQALLDLTFNQFIDFLIHIFHANDLITHNDTIVFEQFTREELNHVPRWQLPELKFADEISGLYSTMIDVTLPTEVEEHLIQIRQQLQDQYSDDIADTYLPENQITSLVETQVLNLQDFLSFLGNIVLIQKKGIVKYKQFQELISILMKVGKTAVSNLQDSTSEKKILLFTHLIAIFDHHDQKIIQFCQELLRSLNFELTQLPDAKQKSYQWLVDSAKAIIANEVIRYNVEEITEDIILRSLGDRFFQPEKTDLETWYQTLATAEIPSAVFLMMIKGYQAVEAIFRRYYNQLVDPDIERLYQINQFNLDLVLLYEELYSDSTTLPLYQQDILIDACVTSAKNHIIYFPTQSDHILDNVDTSIDSSDLAELYSFDRTIMDLLTDNYDFSSILSKIEFSGTSTDQLVGNDEFETHVLQVYASAFNKTQWIQVNTGQIPLRKYKDILTFVLPWFDVLLSKQRDQQIVVMVFLPFIQVVIKMIEQYFDRKNRLTAANLYHLNTYLLKLQLSQNFNYPDFDSLDSKKSKGELIDQFLEILEKYDIVTPFDVSEIRYFALDQTLDLSNIDLEMDESVIDSKKLDEKNMMKYMELRDNLGEFIDELEEISWDRLQDWFTSPRFKPRENPTEVFDHFRSMISTCIYPYITKIHVYAAALSFFSIDIELPRFDISSEL